jgi:hypothetical protein
LQISYRHGVEIHAASEPEALSIVLATWRKRTGNTVEDKAILPALAHCDALVNGELMNDVSFQRAKNEPELQVPGHPEG